MARRREDTSAMTGLGTILGAAGGGVILLAFFVGTGSTPDPLKDVDAAHEARDAAFESLDRGQAPPTDAAAPSDPPSVEEASPAATEPAPQNTQADASEAPATAQAQAQAVEAPAPAPCIANREALLALDQAAFDQDMDGGWRPIAAREGCEDEAADLIRDYRGALAERAGRSLDVAINLEILYWHEAQVRAGIGQTGEAMALFELAKKDEDPAWNAYADASIAFLARDRAGLDAARATLAAVPQPDNWPDAAAEFQTEFGREITWPPNLDVVDGFVACFDAPYETAYGSECRAEAASTDGG